MSEEVQDDPGTKDIDAQTGAECGLHTVDTSTNVSNSDLRPQMTAPSDLPGKWICEMCTYENFALSKKCTMCRSSKPLLGEDIFRLQDDGASALPLQQDLCGAEAVTEKLKPLRIASPQGQTSTASCIAKWSCPTCTYENWPRSLKCAMCGHMNPAPASPEHTTNKQKAPIGINDISQNASKQELHEVDSMSRRSKLRSTDWLWLQACLGVVDGDIGAVEAYLSSGGSAARSLSAHEVSLLNRASAFDPGHTLVHLAIRFQRQDILSTLLSRISGGGPGLKRSPSYIAPDLASAIRRHIASSIRRKKGSFQCQYINEICTFCLPAEIEELPAAIQEQLFTELLDQDAQRCLETDKRINWNPEITLTLGSRLYALWNRSLGDCLCDAICQGAYGVFDRDNALRIALAETMHPPHYSLFSRWCSMERSSARALHYAPDETQLRTEWGRLVRAAATPRTPLNQIHIFALAHVMRRPIIVYGINVVNSFRGEALGYAKFEGVYLPLAWEHESCSTSPLCIGYTRGHFSALVPLEQHEHNADLRREEDQESDVAYLPLTDADGKLLPVHFLDCDEMVDEEAVLRRWLSVCLTPEGCLSAKQRIHSRPLLVAQMLEEWLNHYRRLAQQTRGPFPPRIQPIDYSSEPETDEE